MTSALDRGEGSTDRRTVLLVVTALSIVTMPILLMVLNPPAPWVWLLSLEGLLFILAAAALRARGRLVLVNIGLILFVLLGFEVSLMIYKALKPKSVFTGTYTANYSDKDHPILGYAPYPNNIATSTKRVDGEWIYSVSYTIGPDALRITPEAAEGVQSSVLFFGCSFMFGEGVDDEETLPYRVGILAAGRYAAQNFALHGYGAHQMLAALERGYVEERIARPPKYVVYMGAPFHAERARGASWDRNGPRYVLDDSGKVEYTGRFSDSRGFSGHIGRWIYRHVMWSALGKAILVRIAPRFRTYRDLYLAIVDAAGRYVEREFPGCEFHVIFWDDPAEGPDYAGELQSMGIRVHRMTEIIPDVFENRARYTLHRLDGHPNAAALDRIARYVAESILMDGNRAPSQNPPLSK